MHNFAAYFDEGKYDVNYIAVVWPAYTLNYASARRRVNIVGPYVADLVDHLVENFRLQLDTVHLIGHSLGAHIAGIGMNWLWFVCALR